MHNDSNKQTFWHFGKIEKTTSETHCGDSRLCGGLSTVMWIIHSTVGLKCFF